MKIVMLLLTFAFSLSLGAETEISNLVDPLADLQSQGAIYTFNDHQEIEPLAARFGSGDFVSNSDKRVIKTNPGEAIHVSDLGTGGLIISFILPEEEKTKQSVPWQIVVSQETFASLSLQYRGAGELSDLPKYESGYSENVVASRAGGGAKARRHQYANVMGGGGNCVQVVGGITGYGPIANGVDFASRLISASHGKYQPVSLNYRQRGTVCSWRNNNNRKASAKKRRNGAGHVGYYNGHCFEPYYPGTGECGDPGPDYTMIECVAPR
jgi:hypothetical protein